MSIIDELIIDRTSADVERIEYLNSVGWEAMSEEDRAEWLIGHLEILRDGNGEQLFDANNVELYVRDGKLKGAYNATDLNRVGAAVQYVADHLAEHDYHVTVTPKTDWAMTDIPTVSQMQTYLNDVETIRTALTPVTPLTPTTMDNLDYISANAIEQILLTVETLIFGMIAAFRHCGTTYSNMGGLFL